MNIPEFFRQNVREYHHADTPDKKAVALEAVMLAIRMAQSRKIKADRVMFSPFAQPKVSIAGRRYV